MITTDPTLARSLGLAPQVSVRRLPASTCRRCGDAFLRYRASSRPTGKRVLDAVAAQCSRCLGSGRLGPGARPRGVCPTYGAETSRVGRRCYTHGAHGGRKLATCRCGREFWPWTNGKNAAPDCGCGSIARLRDEAREAVRIARAVADATARATRVEEARAAALRGSTNRLRRRILTWSYGNHAVIPMEELYARDEATCWLCGRFIPPDFGRKYNHAESPTRDHVVPLSKGGEHKWSNVRLAHRGCNSSRGAR